MTHTRIAPSRSTDGRVVFERPAPVLHSPLPSRGASPWAELRTPRRHRRFLRRG